MKKIILIAAAILCIGLGTASFSTAGDHDNDDNKLKTIGEVTMVDTKQQLVEIKDQNGKVMTFKITPGTELEFEDNGMLSWNDDAAITDLKPGQWLKVKYFGTGEVKAADDIKIYKVKDR